MLNLHTIISALGGELIAPLSLAKVDLAQTAVHAIAPLEKATAQDISFVARPQLLTRAAASKAGVLIVSKSLADKQELASFVCIVTDDAYVYYARLTQLWRQLVLRRQQADVAHIHPSAVIEAGAQIADTAVIGPLCHIGAHAVIGPDTLLHARVSVGADCTIGARCIVHAGAVIGADGFGFAQDNGRWIKIEQLGKVHIGDDVEIGANTCIDRGALDDTVIEEGVKLDNLIQIGHNVRIGKHSALAGCVGVAGSAEIGAHCTIGGGAVVLGHLRLGDGVHISAASVVTKSISKPGLYTGIFPLDDNAAWEKNAVTLKQLHLMRQRLRHLQHSGTQ